MLFAVALRIFLLPHSSLVYLDCVLKKNYERYDSADPVIHAPLQEWNERNGSHQDVQTEVTKGLLWAKATISERKSVLSLCWNFNETIASVERANWMLDLFVFLSLLTNVCGLAASWRRSLSSSLRGCGPPATLGYIDRTLSSEDCQPQPLHL